MRNADFSVFAERPVRLKAGCFNGSDTLQVVEQREYESTCATMAAVYNAVPRGHGDTLSRAVEAFNAIMAEIDVPAARPPIAPLSPFAASMLGAGTSIAAE